LFEYGRQHPDEAGVASVITALQRDDDDVRRRQVGFSQFGAPGWDDIFPGT
jgi:hypothetical protein